MAFEPPTSIDYGSSDSRFMPQAPPPAAPPPPPPEPPTTTTRNDYSAIKNPLSPNVINYDDYVEPSPASRRAKRIPTQAIGSATLPQEDPSIRLFASTLGDTNIRPNTGESNAAVGEESLQESLWKGRVVNIAACTVALLLEIPNLLGHVFRIHPARAVLGLYLSFFSLLLLGYEIDMFGRNQIRQYFGLLHHPVGRSFVVFLMGGLAIGQGGIFDLLVGIVFVWSALYNLVTYIWYPQYRQRTSLEEERQSLFEQAKQNHAWADPEQHVGEAVSLLQKAAAVTPKK